MNFKCYEYEIISPITCNCPNTDMLSTDMSNLHTMTSTQMSTQFSEPLLVLLTSAGLKLNFRSLMIYVTLQQQLCGKHDVWHNFQDGNYFQKNNNYNFVTLAQLTKYSRNTTKQYKKHALITDKFLMKLSTHPESTVACNIYKISPCRNEILHAVLDQVLKKRVSNLRRGKMPLFTVLSFRTPKSVDNLKII